MDQDFIADDDGENTQETGELLGLTPTEEQESESQSRGSHNPRWNAPSSRPSPPAQPPPQWYLDGMGQISDTDSDDDDVIGYFAGRSRKKQPATKAKSDEEAPPVSCK